MRSNQFSAGAGKIITSFILLLLTIAAGIAPAHSIGKQPEHMVIVTGIVTDSACGATHGNRTKHDAECTRLCVKFGASYALAVGRKVYYLEGHRAELDRSAGDDVVITGRLLGRDTVYVESIVPLIAEAAIRSRRTQH